MSRPNRSLPAVTALAAALLVGGGCSRDLPELGVAPDVPAPALERARGATQALAGDLIGRLTAAQRETGTAGAVAVCSQVAQDIAASRSDIDMTVRRVTLRVRNPADRPDEYEADRLRSLEALHAQGRLPTETAELHEEEGRPVLRYLRPLTVRAMCLECHGDPKTFDQELRDILAERYPDDQAVGYELDDLRGAVSVRMTLDGSPL